MSKGDFVPLTDWLGLARKHRVVNKLMASKEGRKLENKVLVKFDQGSAEPFDGKLFSFYVEPVAVEGAVPCCDIDFGDPVNCVKHALWASLPEEVRDFMWRMKYEIIASLQRDEIAEIVSSELTGALLLRFTPKIAATLLGKPSQEGPPDDPGMKPIIGQEPVPGMYPGLDKVNDILFKVENAKSPEEQAETFMAMKQALDTVMHEMVARIIEQAVRSEA